tara:strand:+ start:660 stop:887 length:228 start_codon:yes stop_codon:yes gene_type:complete
MQPDAGACSIALANSLLCASLSRVSVAEQIDTPIACGFIELGFDGANRVAHSLAKTLPDRSAELPLYLLVASLRL